MSMQNISDLANKVSSGQSSANTWEDQPPPASCLLCTHTEVLYSACNTMLCCQKTVLELGNVSLSFYDRGEEL